MHKTSPAYDSRSAGHAESGIRNVKEKVRTLICFTRELHGVTVRKSHVSHPRCVRFAAQIIRRSHLRTDGMTGYRGAYGRSRMPRRYVLWSEKYFTWSTPRERTKSRRSGTRGFSSESKTNLRSPTCFFREAFEEFHKRILEMVSCSTSSEEPRENYNLERRSREQGAFGCPGCNPRVTSPPPTVGEHLPRRVCVRRSVELARYRYTDRCIGCQYAERGTGTQTDVSGASMRDWD